RGMAKRVLDNIWIDPAEESGYLTRPEIEIALEVGKEIGATYQTSGLHGVEYVASVDYGARRDRTAMCVMHRNGDGIYVLDTMEVLQGSPGNPVPIAYVESWIEKVANNFHNPRIVIDPWQMEGTVQRYENRLRVERFDGRSGKSNYEMAELLRSLLVNRKLAFYPDPAPLQVGNRRETLVDELAALIIKQAGAVYRFDHSTGLHDDRTVCMGMALVTLAGMHQSGPWIKVPALKESAKVDYSLKPLRGTVYGLNQDRDTIRIFG
ncbi:MAG: hypothetical protein ACO3F3_18270, partial [Gemmataceae bacterium]